MSTVLIIGDTHFPAARRGYVRFLQSVADRVHPDRIVHIGDAVDWHAISMHEHNPNCQSAGFEFKTAKRQFHQLVAAFPKADWLIGNHDSLTERQAAKAGLPSDVLKSYADLWEVPWTVHARYSELTIEGVVYMHLEGPHGPAGLAALNRAKMRFRSVVGGHVHSEGGVQVFANDEFRVFGLAVGCGVDRDALQMYYGKPIPKKPILGCGVVEDGKRAYFEPWCLKSR